ncbi:OPT family oligopeptide transporter [Anaeromyxobacter paludicola]|uniref:Oligopeptide transporter, OPT family n=1 Tax=Anaeromyxobacter paludicola TaxID=2918171 RepID=A0ABM7XED5_9BACT|nr:oligopeptide transporter, OPT family [Anaeromyxobacter paludicola]BDG10247.1 hypothetical protein AMPC_33600 [Anaeromyxobacter paludicola]
MSPKPLVPYVPPDRVLRDFTFRAVALGVLLSIVFGMVNAYVGLRIGLTVSASIPSAVLSMAVLRGIFKNGTILENNVTHAVGSTGESVAAGVIFTLPALLFLGVRLSPFQIFLLGAVAGLLGLLMMIPLRRGLMVEEHGTLPFPEGTACAKVLIAGDKGGTTARPVILGGLVGIGYKLATGAFSLWKDSVTWTFAALHKATIGFDLSPLMLGVGYLIGPRVAGEMLAGGVLGFCVLIPFFDAAAGTGLGAALGVAPEAAGWSALGGEHSLWSEYVRYVGAGGVAFGGMVSLLRALPTIGSSFRGGLAAIGAGGDGAKRAGGAGGLGLVRPALLALGLFAVLSAGLRAVPALAIGGVPVWEKLGAGDAALMAGIVAAIAFAATWSLSWLSRSSLPRNDRDLPIPVVLGGALLLSLGLWLVPQLGLDLLGTVVAVVFSFFFVVVSARMVGLIGTTSQPMSGMVITALLATTVLFKVLGRTGPETMTMVILVGAVVSITISMSGDLAQDLKTGALIGTAPAHLQVGQMIGTVAAALRAGSVLLLLDAAYGLGSKLLPAPQARLMATIVRGVMEGRLPWRLMLLGVAICVVAWAVFKVSPLTFAIGLYLPITTSAPLVFGGLVSLLLARRVKDPARHAEADERATLAASGMIAGDALTGIAIAALTVTGLSDKLALRALGEGPLEDLVAVAPFAVAAFYLYRAARGRRAGAQAAAEG